MNEQQNNPQLDVNDIFMALTIIKTAMTRGAFKPEEYVQVGMVHDKLNSYIEKVKADAEASARQDNAANESAGDDQ